MADPVKAVLGRPFPEQVAAFRLRLGNLIPTERWDDIAGPAHDRGFMVAGANKAELLADLVMAVDKEISQGTSLEEFRRDFREIVARHGWHGWTGEGTKAGEAWRTRVIYRTNASTTYAAGRFAQLTEGNFRFWVYRHGGSHEPRPHHLALDGLILPPDHPFWLYYAPPNGWGCSCYIVGARSLAGAIRLGGDPAKSLPPDWDKIDPRTGAPTGIDKGWDHAPGATVAPLITALKDKLPAMPARIGAAFYASLPAYKVDLAIVEFGQFVDRALRSRVERNYIIIGALHPDWIAAGRARQVEIATAEIAVTDQGIQHTFRGTGLVTAPSTKSVQRAAKIEALDLDWYKQLPRHLSAPRAVLLDTTKSEPVLLLIYDVPGRQVKLVVEINTPVKKAGRLLNTVQSGRYVSEGDVFADLGRGIVQIAGSPLR